MKRRGVRKNNQKYLWIIIFLIIIIGVAVIAYRYYGESLNVGLSPGVNAICTGFGTQYASIGDASCGYYLSNKDKHRIYPDQNAKPVTIKSYIEGNINNVKTTTCSSTSYCNSPVDAFVVEVIDSSGDKDCYNQGVLVR